MNNEKLQATLCLKRCDATTSLLRGKRIPEKLKETHIDTGRTYQILPRQ